MDILCSFRKSEYKDMIAIFHFDVFENIPTT